MYRRANKNILLAGLVLLCSLFVSAQVNVRAIVNRDKILIGEPISLVVETYMPLGTDFRWFNSDSIPFFQITERSAIDTLENMDGKKISQTLMITSFDSGTQYVPPFEIMCRLSKSWSIINPSLQTASLCRCRSRLST
jgi:hypothetical protein